MCMTIFQFVFWFRILNSFTRKAITDMSAGFTAAGLPFVLYVCHLLFVPLSPLALILC